VHPYGVREVEKLLRLPRSTIRALIDAGFVTPARGPRRSWRFSFQDLIVLRTAQALAAANVPRRRITRSVRELRRHLPEALPLSGISICAVADRVVVKEGASRWHPESGQYLLGFEANPADGSLNVIDRRADAGSLFQKALSLESEDQEASLQAYRQAIAADAKLLDAHINLGLLLHEAGRSAEAEQAYRAGLEACSGDPLLWYNLAVLLEDLGRKLEAVAAYEAALKGDPRMADGHYNLALLCEELDRPRDAIRHMAQYRRLRAE
jgi:tetratricopeptide (TPR) repeat protein